MNLLKLCVGAKTVDDLVNWQRYLMQKYGHVFHTTRMVPKREAELSDGGSIYWVIAGQICVRQRILDIEPFTDGEGIRRCHLKLDETLVLTQMRPQRPFQGWRYLAACDAPPDISAQSQELRDIPEEMRRELSELGLI